ncbi:MAG TPA: hypothetical protein GX708_14915, partial [Gallicola sp.]|nr:hypothetical protein [Gallicola sp.]
NELAKTDNKTKVLRNGEYVLTVGDIQKGDEYEVSNERGKQILSHPKNLAMLIEIVKEEVKEPIEDKEVEKMVEETKKKTTKKKTTTKKKAVKKK